MAVTAAGELLSWGCGSRGQLGHGATAVPANRDESQPRLISSLKATDVKTAAAGGARSGLLQAALIARILPSYRKCCMTAAFVEVLKRISYAMLAFVGCIDENGQTWTWGDNANYELGHRKLPQLQDPKQVS